VKIGKPIITKRARTYSVGAGIVYNPVLEELFVAATGYGAYLNGRKLRTSSCKTLDAALVVCASALTPAFARREMSCSTRMHILHRHTCTQLSEFGYQREPSKLSTILLCVQRVCARGARGYRQLGSGALDLCYVGAGRLDCLFAGVAGEGWSPWDYAAGAC
jgi:fructose-1,6-bisphosphatase/inositol monophosphatase family enzyme